MYILVPKLGEIDWCYTNIQEGENSNLERYIQLSSKFEFKSR
jgi:hypothetical protein